MSLINSLKEFLLKCSRVWAITKKPDGQEFRTIAKAAAIGLLIIGFIGFAVSIIIRFLGK